MALCVAVMVSVLTWAAASLSSSHCQAQALLAAEQPQTAWYSSGYICMNGAAAEAVHAAVRRKQVEDCCCTANKSL